MEVCRGIRLRSRASCSTKQARFLSKQAGQAPLPSCLFSMDSLYVRFSCPEKERKHLGLAHLQGLCNKALDVAAFYQKF